MTEVIVEPGALSTHCGQLGTRSGRMQEAVQAAGFSTGLSPLAFGILCQFLTPACVGVQAVMLGALGATGGLLDATGGAVRACDTSYREVDDAVAASLRRLQP